EGESGRDQRVVLFDEVVRVPEAAVASLRRQFDWQTRQHSRDRVRVVEAQSRSPAWVRSLVEAWRPVRLVTTFEPLDRFRDAWIRLGKAHCPQSQNTV